MKPLWKTILIPLSAATLGALIMLLTFIYSPTLQSKVLERSEIEDQLSLRDSFFREHQDLFKEHQDIRKKFDSLFESAFSGDFGKGFTHSFSSDLNTDITMREDASYVYYDIPVDDVKATTINTVVENNYVTIEGTTEKKSDANNEHSVSVFKSTFKRTFPLPENVDQHKLKLIAEKDKYVVRFPKMTI